MLVACGGDNNDSREAPHPLPAQSLELTILHINDHHSNLDSKNKTLQLLNDSGDRTAVTVDAGGFTRIVSAFSELEAESDHVLKLHAGDALTGTLYFSRAGEIGEADAAMMNAVCFDAFTLGNHEFDKGDTVLKQWLELLNSGDCQTPALSANVQFGAESALHDSHSPGLVSPYTIVERAGQKIGIVGLTIADKTKSSSSPDADTTFEDEIVAAQRAIDTLQEQDVNKIVVLSHIGYEYDKQVLAVLSGVDVVIGADSHTLLGPEALTLYGVGSTGGTYGAALKNRDGDNVCLAQAWEYAQVVGELKVSFDSDGRVTACNGTPHVLIGDNFQIQGEAVSAGDRSAILADIAASGFLRVTAPDLTASAILKPYQESVEIYKETVVANAPIELCSRRVPGGPGSVDYTRSSASCNAEGSVDTRGGDIQQLVAQAYLDVANLQYGGADFSLQSGGGVRLPLQAQVTAANVIEVLPFDMKLWKLSITGAEAKAMIEDGLEATFGPNGSTGPYPYAGGLRWDVDANKPRGSRASNFEKFDNVSGSWLPLDESSHYRLFVLGFNATGGDGYETLAQIPDERRYDVGVQDADVLLTYIDTLARDSTGYPAILRLDHSLYSTKSFIGPAAR
nr:5'-nucleotidase C-terminal domain-containing protein [Mesopusillimonas faecipullorum]